MKITSHDHLNPQDRLVVLGRLVSEEFMRTNRDSLNWKMVSCTQTLTTSFMREMQDHIDWVAVSMYQELDEEFMEEFQDKLDWVILCRTMIFPERLIRKFKDRFNWRILCVHQSLSEEFIRENLSSIDWLRVSLCQRSLSEGFVREFKDKLLWGEECEFLSRTVYSLSFLEDFGHLMSKSKFHRALKLSVRLTSNYYLNLIRLSLQFPLGNPREGE